MAKLATSRLTTRRHQERKEKEKKVPLPGPLSGAALSGAALSNHTPYLGQTRAKKSDAWTRSTNIDNFSPISSATLSWLPASPYWQASRNKIIDPFWGRSANAEGCDNHVNKA